VRVLQETKKKNFSVSASHERKRNFEDVRIYKVKNKDEIMKNNTRKNVIGEMNFGKTKEIKRKKMQQNNQEIVREDN